MKLSQYMPQVPQMAQQMADLNKQISLLDMINIIEKSIEKITFVQNPKLEDLLEIDLETRKFVKSII